MGYSPVMLNSLVPELTRRMTGKIFATDLEDWPALLRAMRETGEEFKQGKVAPVPVGKNGFRALELSEVMMRDGRIMTTKYLSLCGLFLLLLSGGGHTAASQQDSSRIRVNVVLVQLNVAVTDHKGNYISGLRPQDFEITEDKIPETIATFEEGDEPGIAADTPDTAAKAPEPPPVQQPEAGKATVSELQHLGANVYVLFDTSNYMYRGFVYAQDAIADFVRSLEPEYKVAFYSYSRDLSGLRP